MKTLRSGEVGSRLAGLGGAADFHAEVVGIEKPSMRPEKVPEEAKEGRGEKSEDWFVGSGR